MFELHSDKRDERLYLLKADDNILFFLDYEMDFLVGDGDFSFTLNRAATLENFPRASLESAGLPALW